MICPGDVVGHGTSCVQDALEFTLDVGAIGGFRVRFLAHPAGMPRWHA